MNSFSALSDPNDPVDPTDVEVKKNPIDSNNSILMRIPVF
jgi:hypothetical protein